MTTNITANPFDHVGLTAKGGQRMCGTGRQAGSIYVECGLFLNGTPIHQYLKDPPERIQPAMHGMSRLGVQVITKDGISHIIDWVGEDSYPYPADFIEEAKRMGVSRKIQPNADLRLIGKNSFLILVHSKGSMNNMEEVSAATDFLCPNLKHQQGERCCGLHWAAPGDENNQRQLAEGSYDVIPPSPDAPKPEYVPAIFMAVPISAITIIRNHDGSVNNAAWESVSKSGFTPNVSDL